MDSRLFTDHDKYHLHKILGFGCLIHYNLRLYYKLVHGTMYFGQNSMITYGTPLIHLGLSVSSFIFHVPKNRFESKVIIWKELQLHNIIFVSRSACMMLFSFTKLNYFYKLGILVGHHLLADYVSNKYINNDKTTTRDIPYSNKTIGYYLKKYYAISQTVALSSLLLNDNSSSDKTGLYENAFLIMYPIQLSAFLMTLVRKQIISNNLWHLFYGLSLSLPYFVNYLNPKIDNKFMLKTFLGLFYTISRFSGLNKYLGMFIVVYAYTCSIG